MLRTSSPTTGSPCSRAGPTCRTVTTSCNTFWRLTVRRFSRTPVSSRRESSLHSGAADGVGWARSPPLSPPTRRTGRPRAVEPGRAGPRRTGNSHRPAPFPFLLGDGHGSSTPARHPARAGPRPDHRHVARGASGSDHSAHGASTSGGRRRAVPRLRPSRPRGVASLPGVRGADSFHHGGRDPRRDVRRDAVPRDRGRRRASRARPSLRGGCPCARREGLDGFRARDAPPPPARDLLRRGAVLGSRTRRVRRDHHLRRQLPRSHADRPAGGLYRVRDAARRRHRAQPHPPRRVARDPRGHARPVARRAVKLEAEIRIARDGFALDVELEIASTETVAVLGPNGAGKTTLLRALAGLIPIEGRVVLDGDVLDDSAKAIHVPTERRRVGLVFQDHVLFPHMSVLDNVAFGLRAECRGELSRQLADFKGVRILVTHDPLEAMALADRLVVLEGGRIVQSGTPAEVSARPRSRFPHQRAGVNLRRGRGHGDHIEIEPGGALLAAPDAGDGDVLAVIHPRAVALYMTKPEGTPRNVWRGRAEDLDLQGERVRVRVSGPVPLVAEVTPSAVRDLHLAGGAEVWVSVKATEISVYRA